MRKGDILNSMHNTNSSGFTEHWISSEMTHSDFTDIPMLDAGSAQMVEKTFAPWDFTDLLLISNGLFCKFIDRIDKHDG